MKLEKKNLPKHVAIIMDGNRRWARERGLPVMIGHKVAVEKILEPLIDYAIEIKIPHLTFWAFSTENWKRTKKEVEFLLNLFRENLDKKVDKFHQKNVKVNIVGNLSLFPPDIQKKTQSWMEKTKKNTKITVNFALSYGGRDEIVRAINRWYSGSRLKAAGSRLTEKEFEKYLDTAGMPDPDLMIRTGGEMRLSGYLPWQSVYSELYFTKTYWPDFTPKEFARALREYQRRQRRFGR